MELLSRYNVPFRATLAVLGVVLFLLLCGAPEAPVYTGSPIGDLENHKEIVLDGCIMKELSSTEYSFQCRTLEPGYLRLMRWPLLFMMLWLAGILDEHALDSLLGIVVFMLFFCVAIPLYLLMSPHTREDVSLLNTKTNSLSTHKEEFWGLYHSKEKVVPLSANPLQKDKGKLFVKEAPEVTLFRFSEEQHAETLRVLLAGQLQ